MTSINQIHMTVTGNIGEVKYRTSQRGTTFARFDIAQTSRNLDTNAGRWDDGATTWIHVVAVGQLADHMRDSGIAKGARLTVTGAFEQREYQTDDGQKRNIQELNADDVAVSLRFALVRAERVPTTNGFAGRTSQSAQQPTTPQQQPSGGYTDGFFGAQQQPAI